MIGKLTLGSDLTSGTMYGNIVLSNSKEVESETFNQKDTRTNKRTIGR